MMKKGQVFFQTLFTLKLMILLKIKSKDRDNLLITTSVPVKAHASIYVYSLLIYVDFCMLQASRRQYRQAMSYCRLQVNYSHRSPRSAHQGQWAPIARTCRPSDVSGNDVWTAVSDEVSACQLPSALPGSKGDDRS